MQGHEIVARTLSDCGVTTLFGFMGDANMLHVASFVDVVGGRFVHSVHEGGAVGMADGYGRTTGEIGVATVTHGPGTTNTLTALTEAVKARTALLLLTSDTPSLRNQIQHIDLKAFADAAQAEYRRVDAVEFIADDIAQVFARLQRTRIPVVLDIPFDLQLSEAGPYVAPRFAQRQIEAARPAPEAAEHIAQLLRGRARPIVLAGRGAREANAGPEILEFAHAIGAPVATTLLGRGLFAGDSHNLDLFGGLSNPLTMETIRSADAVISFGAALNDFTAGVGKVPEGSLLANKLVIQIDHDLRAFSLHRPVDVEVLGDARETARSLLHAVRVQGTEPSGFRSPELAADIASYNPLSEFTDRSTDITLDMRRVVIALNERLPKNRVVITDGGRNRTPVWRFMAIQDPRDFVHTSSFGSIGLGTATAVGASIARPETCTVGIFGDGGGMMGLMEFSTAVRERSKLILVVMNDRCYGTEYGKLEEYGVDPRHSLMDWPSFVEVAKAFGGDGVLARTLSELDTAVDRAITSDVPFLIEVPADPRFSAEILD